MVELKRKPEKSDVGNLLLSIDKSQTEKILELGFSGGRLIGGKLSDFTFPEVKLPVDFHDFHYIFLDTDGIWRNKLLRELSGAGLL